MKVKFLSAYSMTKLEEEVNDFIKNIFAILDIKYNCFIDDANHRIHYTCMIIYKEEK